MRRVIFLFVIGMVLFCAYGSAETGRSTTYLEKTTPQVCVLKVEDNLFVVVQPINRVECDVSLYAVGYDSTTKRFFLSPQSTVRSGGVYWPR